MVDPLRWAGEEKRPVLSNIWPYLVSVPSSVSIMIHPGLTWTVDDVGLQVERFTTDLSRAGLRPVSSCQNSYCTTYGREVAQGLIAGRRAVNPEYRVAILRYVVLHEHKCMSKN